MYRDANWWYDRDVSAAAKWGDEVRASSWPISSITLLSTPKLHLHTPKITLLYSAQNCTCMHFNRPSRHDWWTLQTWLRMITLQGPFLMNERQHVVHRWNIHPQELHNFISTPQFFSHLQDYFLVVNLWRIMVITHNRGVIWPHRGCWPSPDQFALTTVGNGN